MIKLKIRIFLFIAMTFFFHGTIYTQTNNINGNSDISCKVIDQFTKDNIAYATVSIVNLNNGVITDDEGSFRLPYKYKIQNNTLLISSIGYETKKIAVKDLLDNELNVIELKPLAYALDLVTIVAKKKGKQKSVNADYQSSTEIVRKAIYRLKTNFPTTPHSYIAYYRDYQLVKKRYFNVNEAILEVYDGGMQTNKLLSPTNQTVIYSYQTNTDFSVDSQLNVPYGSGDDKFIKSASISSLGGNELGLLNVHNPIRNYEYYSFSFIDIFEDDFLENHLFMTPKLVYIDTTALYEIGFYTLDEVIGNTHYATGKIYVSKENFSIYKLEYDGFVKKAKQPFYSLKVEYVMKENKMYLKYISFNNKFKVKSEQPFQITDLSFESSENAFYINFNNALDRNSIDKSKNFKFDYKGEKLTVQNISVISDFALKVNIEKIELLKSDMLIQDDLDNVNYKIKGLRDVAGRLLNKKSYIDVDQFRELFVQEHFIGKELPNDAIFVDKYKPLIESKINESILDDNTYWINTPLKIMKGN